MKKTSKISIRYQVSDSGYRVLRIFSVVGLFTMCVFLQACGGDDDEAIAPKPRAYYRLNLPDHKYLRYDADCPFTFERSVYSQVAFDKNVGAQPCWINLEYPSLRGTVHLSYHEVKGNVQTYMEDTYTLASKHQIKASGIEEKLVSRDSSKVYGLIYEIGGNAASSIQFFLTDSTRHFIRGALYFNAVPNTDSITPVVDFVRKDIYHMIETFEWKDVKKITSAERAR